MNKRTVAKVIGASAVGVGGLFLLRKAAGRELATSVFGSMVLLMLHETLDAPVSGWVYKQL